MKTPDDSEFAALGRAVFTSHDARVRAQAVLDLMNVRQVGGLAAIRHEADRLNATADALHEVSQPSWRWAIRQPEHEAAHVAYDRFMREEHDRVCAPPPAADDHAANAARTEEFIAGRERMLTAEVAVSRVRATLMDCYRYARDAATLRASMLAYAEGRGGGDAPEVDAALIEREARRLFDGLPK